MSDRSDYEIQTNTQRIAGIYEEKEVAKTGRPFFFDVTTKVKLGDFFNAAKAQLRFSGAGGEVAGMASAFNAEIYLPNKIATSGSYTALETNYNFQASTVLQSAGAPQAIASFKVGGDQGQIDVWEDQANAGVFSFQGLTQADGSIYSDGTAETMSGTLKIMIGNTAKYIMLCSAGATA